VYAVRSLRGNPFSETIKRQRSGTARILHVIYLKEHMMIFDIIRVLRILYNGSGKLSRYNDLLSA